MLNKILKSMRADLKNQKKGKKGRNNTKDGVTYTKKLILDKDLV